jgi:D-sedoheptulose 7-phosphate isomerase
MVRSADMADPMAFLEGLLARYPALASCRGEIVSAFRTLEGCFAGGGKLLVCGNGGSSADADHIVGELMKGYLKARPLPQRLREALAARDPELGQPLASRLQGALPAVNISAQSALSTAFANDVSAELVFAQQVLGLGRPGDVLLGISTSGGARNVLAALAAARACGLATIGLTGKAGGKMPGLCDVLIRVPAALTYEVQELHLPVYHCLCAMIEERFFPA